jgi:Tol biopolymer transport system component
MIYAHQFRDINIWRQELSSHAGKLKVPESLIASTAHDGSPQYSPDGNRIAFQSERSGNFEVWICDSEGKRCRQLTSFNGPVTGTPRWSPDGRRIAFDSAAEGNYHIYAIDAEGGAPKRLSHGEFDAIPSWSTDGKWIYFASHRTGRQEVWKVPSSGGTEIQVTRDGGAVAFESPDGQHLFYTATIGFSSLYRSNVDGSDGKEIANNVVGRGLAVTRDQIFYLHQEHPGLVALRSLPITGGKSGLITTFTRPMDLGLSISPDLRYALYSQVDHEGSTIMLVDQFY